MSQSFWLKIRIDTAKREGFGPKMDFLNALQRLPPLSR